MGPDTKDQPDGWKARVKYLYLLRHAKAAWDHPGGDKDRILNARGIRACAFLADHYRQNGIVPAAIWCSTAHRTRETLERIFSRAGWQAARSHITYADDLYLASPACIAAHVRLTEDAARTVLVIGHNPGIEDLARQLTGDDPGNHRAALDRKYPTGGLVGFLYNGARWDDLSEGSCTLRSFVTPRDLEASADEGV